MSLAHSGYQGTRSSDPPKMRYLQELWGWIILMAICLVSGLCFPLCWSFLSVMWMIMKIMLYLTLWESFMLSESFHWVSWSCSCLHYARWEWGTQVLCWLGNMSYFPAAPYGCSLNCPNLKTLRTPKLDINLHFHSEPFWRIWLKGNRFKLRQTESNCIMFL